MFDGRLPREYFHELSRVVEKYKPCSAPYDKASKTFTHKERLFMNISGKKIVNILHVYVHAPKLTSCMYACSRPTTYMALPRQCLSCHLTRASNAAQRPSGLRGNTFEALAPVLTRPRNQAHVHQGVPRRGATDTVNQDVIIFRD